MTEQRKAFCNEYLIHFNATRAAIKAGYSEKTAAVQACQILAEDEVALYIQDRLSEISKEAEVDAIWVRKRFKSISDRCMSVVPVMIFDGEAWVESGEYKFDSAGANKATESLGKIIGVFEKDNQQRAVQFDTSKLTVEEMKAMLELTQKATNGTAQ